MRKLFCVCALKNILGHGVAICFPLDMYIWGKDYFLGIISNTIYNHISQRSTINNVIHYHTSIVMCI